LYSAIKFEDTEALCWYCHRYVVPQIHSWM